MRFDFTYHSKVRQGQREITREQAENVVKYGQRVNIPYAPKGIHGGILRKYYKIVGERKLVVICEVKSNTCYVMTNYYENE